MRVYTHPHTRMHALFFTSEIEDGHHQIPTQRKLASYDWKLDADEAW